MVYRKYYDKIFYANVNILNSYEICVNKNKQDYVYVIYFKILICLETRA